MFKWFISNQWKSAIRSSVWQKNLVINIILGFFLLYMIANLLIVGLFLNEILKQVFPGEDVIRTFNSGLFYYFGVDLFIRFYMQDVPVMSIEPYLHLPIPKRKIINYLLAKSLLAVFNFVPIFLALPFCIRVIAPAYGGGIALLLFIGIYGFIFFNNYLILYVKKQIVARPWIALLFGVCLGVLILLEYLHVISLAHASAAFFGRLLEQPVLVLLPLAMVLLMYFLNYRFLLANTYPEEISTRKAGRAVATGDIRFLHRFGEVGELIALEMKLIWRHKRPRSVLILTAAFAFYGLVFYTNPHYQKGTAILIFPGIFLTGIFLFNYGQFLLSWHSNWYDAFLSKNISPFTFVLSRFWILVPVCLLSFVLSIPYVYFGLKILYINFACMLFNIGFNSRLVMFFSMISPKRIDLTKRSAMNWQGVNASQFLLVLIVMVLPFLIYTPFGIMGLPYWGIGAIGIAGIISLLFSRQWNTLLAERLEIRKYRIADGFRESE